MKSVVKEDVVERRKIDISQYQVAQTSLRPEVGQEREQGLQLTWPEVRVGNIDPEYGRDPLGQAEGLHLGEVVV